MPEQTFRFLTVEAVEAIHREVLAAHGGMPGLRDRPLLEAAVAAPHATHGGEALIKDVFEVAAAYLFYLCSNHPFNDGNKRTALGAMLVFLALNGRKLVVPAAELYGVVIAAATSEADVTQVPAWVKKFTAP